MFNCAVREIRVKQLNKVLFDETFHPTVADSLGLPGGLPGFLHHIFNEQQEQLEILAKCGSL
jgi:hypothetical protein